MRMLIVILSLIFYGASSYAGQVNPKDSNQLSVLSTNQLWKNWLTIITDENPNQYVQRARYSAALANQLRQQEDTQFYSEIRNHLTNPAESRLARSRFIYLLGEIATPQALAILTSELMKPNDTFIREVLSRTFSEATSRLYENPRRTGATQVLESAWILPKHDSVQLKTLATAIARLGTVRGVDLLLQSLAGGSEYLKTKITESRESFTYLYHRPETLSYADQKALWAFVAFDEIVYPDSQALLISVFMDRRPKDLIFIAAGNGLVKMGQSEGAKVILSRLHELPEDNSMLGLHWLGIMSGKIERKEIRNALKTIIWPNNQQLQKRLNEF